MWFLQQSHFIIMQEARRNGFVETAEHRLEIEAKGFGPERISAVKGSVATINITGILTQEPDIMAMLFGGGNTTYPEIIGALAAADVDPDVKEISIFIDSPGGEVAGMFQAMDALRDTQKPTTVIGGNFVASAAFGIASQADKIVAAHRSSSFGSIGTAASFFVSDNEVVVASDNAPNKRPDLQTDEGVTAVKRELNQMAALLDDGIAAGRNTTVKKVNANFGKGGMVLAESAIEKEMIDGMVGDTSTQTAASALASSKPKEVSAMNLKELMAEHPAVYAEAVAEGVTKEKDRVSAHLLSGEACGDISIAVKAITDGVAYGHAPTAAAYDVANMKKGHIDASAADDKEISRVADGAEAPAPKTEDPKADAKETALAAIEAQMGTGEGNGGRDYLFMGGVN